MQKDTVVWITGASSGIGESLAKAYSKLGVKLIISARRKEALEKVKGQCAGSPDDILVLPLDLESVDTHAAKTEEVLQKFGKIDVLINNGGVSQRAYAVDATLDSVEKIMRINFFGTVSLTKAVLPGMMARKSGHIVVMSSVMGKFSTSSRTSYAASKHALHGWFDGLRLEMDKYNIAISLVCPGFVKTNITYNALMANGKPLNRMGEAHSKAMTADEFVAKLLPKLMSKKREIIISGFKERIGVLLKQISQPALFFLLKRSKVT